MAFHIFPGKKSLSDAELSEARHRIGRNIALIGFMGSGKTTVGKKVAELLKKSFIDTDTVIENKLGLKVHEIFNKHGEDMFRDLEHKALLEICASRDYRDGNCVIACGGGISLNPLNVDLISDQSVIVKLAVEPHSLLGRLRDKTTRPLIALKSDEEIIELHNSRYKYYLCADLNVDVDDHSPDEAAAKVVHAVLHHVKSGKERKKSSDDTKVFR